MRLLISSVWLVLRRKENFWIRASVYAEQHGQSGINILESRTVG